METSLTETVIAAALSGLCCFGLGGAVAVVWIYVAIFRTIWR